MRLVKIAVALFVLLLLAALIFPAFAPRTGDHRLHVQSEIAAMSASVASFRERFGISPPSRFVLHETSSNWNNSPRYRGIIRQMWPAFNFTTDQDFNGDGDTSDRFELTGAECLVFFLSGVGCSMNETTGRISIVPIGFSANPSSPFELETASRDGPYFDFSFGRFTDVDGDGFPEYVPAFPSAKTPFVYLSSYDGRGYRADDCKIYPAGDHRNLRSAYFKDFERRQPHKANSFQIISAGRDDCFGLGGNFSPDKTDQFLRNRRFDRDNLTNFHFGQLGY